MLHNFLYKFMSLDSASCYKTKSFILFPMKREGYWLLHAQICFETKSVLFLGTKAKMAPSTFSVFLIFFKKKSMFLVMNLLKLYCGLVQLQCRCVCRSHRSFLSVFILRNNNKNMVVVTLCPHLQA